MRFSPVHAASLVDPASHSPAVLELVAIPLTKPVVEYLIESVVETVDFALGRAPTTPSGYLSSFTTFVHNVLTRAEVTPATVLASLVYISRARPHLSIALEEWALERVFLGALIVASKYTNDSTLKNMHWALCTGVFGKRDVGRIEREFLGVLNWELAIKEADLLAHHAALTAVALPSPAKPLPALPRTHTHARHSSSGSLPIPELTPSSPGSSAGSFSPPTPTPVQHRLLPVDMDVAAQKGRFNDLLRAFPMPVPIPIRHHVHREHPRVRVA
ncbi:Cyclin N-terminal domain-containing protein [Mycena indigotica]|uniref:Cyclin N-terminal domain-containing protein n=1 Tax=Mycena indigotica TaxID=2126181 RepID=A0A8H6VX39_9AGAR|nr:Cyclin N-terminal domain-containing protein [Mycena indigotica]KAF7291384.1 Cyclin N-terminal domain-containing protein [Mycena indigotica]